MVALTLPYSLKVRINRALLLNVRLRKQKQNYLKKLKMHYGKLTTKAMTQPLRSMAFRECCIMVWPSVARRYRFYYIWHKNKELLSSWRQFLIFIYRQTYTSRRNSNPCMTQSFRHRNRILHFYAWPSRASFAVFSLAAPVLDIQYAVFGLLPIYL